jgi:hypothetical protein
MAKNKLPKEEPMTINELLYTTSLAKLCGYYRENILATRGMFSALKVTTYNKFHKSEIQMIKNSFKKRFKRNLLFTERLENNGLVSIGYFTKLAN